MADTHTWIERQVILDWTRNKRGRLYRMKQGLAVPIGGKNPVWFGPLNRHFKGFSDLFGFTVAYMFSEQCPVPIFTAVEVKTKNDKVRPAQKDFLDYIVSVGGLAYIAREADTGYDLIPWE